MAVAGIVVTAAGAGAAVVVGAATAMVVVGAVAGAAGEAVVTVGVVPDTAAAPLTAGRDGGGGGGGGGEGFGDVTTTVGFGDGDGATTTTCAGDKSCHALPGISTGTSLKKRVKPAQALTTPQGCLFWPWWLSLLVEVSRARPRY